MLIEIKFVNIDCKYSDHSDDCQDKQQSDKKVTNNNKKINM